MRVRAESIRQATVREASGAAPEGAQLQHLAGGDVHEGEPGVERDKFTLRVDSHLGQLAAIRAGSGIGVCQVEVAREEPDLERVLDREFGVELPL